MRSIAQKGQIWQEFQQLLAQNKRADAKITTKEEIAAKEQEQAIVATASTYTVESIVTGLAELQLTFDRTVDQLTTQLTTESVKLGEVQKAIQIETNHLQQVHHLEIAANALDLLTQEHDAKKQELEEQSSQWRETFTQQISVQREAWQKEQEEHERAIQEHNDLLQNERSVAEADQTYDTERTRKIEWDRYEAKKREIERLHAEKERNFAKEWAAREEVLEACQQELEEYQTQIDAFPAKLENEVKAARDKAIKKANQSAKVKADLLAKEIEANKKVYDLRIQTLERMIEMQNQEIGSLSTELKEALQKVQELANKAMMAPRTAAT